ncbi:acyl-CoA thioesterase [Leptospira selangorensis]|uniref:Acyl-CoA thioesterase n=1 Tax=Leptospira selangorensis TaxID=2484982 RepID=A0A4R9FXP1_9LEPT|nr:acyl-CoA thioesterase [Leptospira selangorensis]TGK03385.1 acyl-CoA thioesterase [Leptospira selangorensis]TGM10809.1 acyl-CoA thioesterase [Leptospira selangorensis]TGM26844.1 acyl-CoA thioesterase [Leptospira selangorensis]
MNRESLDHHSVKLEPGLVIETRQIEMVFPEVTNHYGTLFAGDALSFMAKSAFIAASRYSRKKVVAAKSEQVDFRVPVRQGNLIELISRVVSVGNSSMTIEVELYAEDFLSGERYLGTKGKFVMVALGEDGRPTKVPTLIQKEINTL